MELAVGSRVAFVAMMAFGVAASAQEPPSVGVTGQKVQLDVDGQTLIVEATVENALDVGLESVDVGWLLAASEAQLEAVKEPGLLYLAAEDPKRIEPPTGVTVVRRSVRVAVPPHGRGVASASVPLRDGTPAVYRTHVLGYALADLSFELGMRLLRGTAAADEVAAVDFAAVAGGNGEKRRAREALRRAGWLPGITRLLSTPIVGPPTPAVLHDRIFGIRALGVLGGKDALDVLAPLRDCADMAAFDELLRVMLIDRLRGNRLETPLAFAVPVTARKMSDVFDAAIADARSDFVAREAAPIEPAPAENARVAPAAPDASSTTHVAPLPSTEPLPEPRYAMLFRSLGWAACVIAVVVALLVLRRRK